MAGERIDDPDFLKQGTSTTVTDLVFNSSSGANTRLYSAGGNLPSLGVNNYIEIRSANTVDNDGLYRVLTVNVNQTNVDVRKIDGLDPADDGSTSTTVLGSNTTLTGNTSTQKNIMIDTGLRRIYLLEQYSGGAYSGEMTSNGALLQAVYSFLKEEWKDDDTLNPHPFPMVAITPEQFEFIYDWEPYDVVDGGNTITEVDSRKLVRTGGWREVDTEDGSRLKQEYIGVITLGTFEDSDNDTAYFQTGSDPTDTTSTTDFKYAGPVNEAIRVYYENIPADTVTGVDFGAVANTINRNDGGNFLTDDYRIGGLVTILDAEDAFNTNTFLINDISTDGANLVVNAAVTVNSADTTARMATNFRESVKIFLRIRDGDTNGKTFDQSTLADIGVTTVTNQVYRFPLTNATDLKISATDATISSTSPWNQIEIRYFDQAYVRDVDSGTDRNFGIVIDVGTFSGVDGVTTSGDANLTTAEAGIPSTTYDGGTITIYGGTAALEGYSQTITTAVGANVFTTSNFSESNTAVTFTLQRSTPVVATLQEIYEKVQYQLRQAADIDETDQIITGKTADALLRFVGDALEAGQSIPSNPNGGGSGVFISGFDSNDTNSLTFFDNTGTGRNFPFVAAGTISFNDNLVNDGNAEYYMFYTQTERLQDTTGYNIISASGSTANITGATGDVDFTTELAVGDYIYLDNYTDANNDGIWIVTVTPVANNFTARKVNGDTVSAETGNTSTFIDKNPVNSPDAILVEDNSSVNIAGTISGSSVSFDYDYDNNSQGGRTAPNNANITLRAIGLNSAQFVETTGTITRATGISFSLVAGLERNYSNPT